MRTLELSRYGRFYTHFDHFVRGERGEVGRAAAASFTVSLLPMDFKWKPQKAAYPFTDGATAQSPFLLASTLPMEGRTGQVDRVIKATYLAR